MKRLLPFALLVLGMAAPSLLFSQVPGEISYQGVLTGITGTVDLTLRLYATEIGGTVLWTENHASVELNDDGTFSITLGSVQPLTNLTFERPYWLEIAVNGTILTPRTRMATSPYAFRAETANTVANGSIEPEDLKTTGSSPQNNQVLTFNGTTGTFKWATVSGGGGGITELAEGEGIRIDGLTGPTSTISIASEGITTGMLANGAVTGAKIGSETITAANIADATLTQDKFAPNVGLPNIGAAGGDLAGNYPNPSIADDVIKTSHLKAGSVTTPKIADDGITSDKIANGAVNSEHVNSAARLTVTAVNASDSLISPNLNIKGTTTLNTIVGIGTSPATGKRLLIQGSGATTATSSIEARDNTGNPLFIVRDDGNVGIGTSAPIAGLEIKRGGGVGLAVSNGSTVFSYSAVPAGGAITIPANTTVVQITSDAVPGSPNAVTMPAAVLGGEFLIIVNNDNDPTTGGAVIPAGQAGIFVFLPPPANTWRRVN